MKDLPENLRDADWRLTSWEGSRREQMRRWAALPLDSIVASLEEMAELASAFATPAAASVSDPTAAVARNAHHGTDASTSGGRTPMDIRHEPENHRFVTDTDHGQAVLSYSRIEDGTLDYRSTVVPVEDRGQGIGEELVLFALDWARENDKHVIPSCPFVKRVLEDHPEHQPTIAAGE